MVKVGGRKFIGFIIILGAAGLARQFGKGGLTHEDVVFLIAAYGSFAFGNVINTIAALKGNGGGGQSGAPATPAPVDLRPLEARVNEVANGVELQNQAIQILLQTAVNQPAGRVVQDVDTTPRIDPEAVERAKVNRAAIAKYVQ